MNNGGYKLKIYKCLKCGCQILESYPYEETNDGAICGDCAFLTGMITEKEYLNNYCFWFGLKGARAVIKDGKIYLGTGKFPWERTSRDRECKEYKEWREKIFSRDNFTCQSCGQIGGTLNAHHIKSYKKYSKLRYSAKNGLTLCEQCHRNLHKKQEVS